MLLAPAIDVPRTLLLRIMEMLQGLVLPFFPYWRIVPSPPLHVVTGDPKLVSPMHCIGSDCMLSMHLLLVHTSIDWLCQCVCTDFLQVCMATIGTEMNGCSLSSFEFNLDQIHTAC